MLFSYNTFISVAGLISTKIQANAKQQFKAELLLFENDSFFIHIIIQR